MEAVPRVADRLRAGRRGAGRRDGDGRGGDRARAAARAAASSVSTRARECSPSARSRIDDARLADRIQLVEGSADELPFPDRSFDALTFTYLLRYVEDPAATLAELARVVRPGGAIASLEFGLPRGIWRPLWELYVRVGLPLAGRVISPGWHEVGTFLGPSIRELHARLPISEQVELWRAAGIEDVSVRRLSLGGGYVVWGRRGG